MYVLFSVWTSVHYLFERNEAALSPIFYPTPSQAIFKLIPKEEQAKLPEDENTPEKRANKLWAYFEKKDNGNENNTRVYALCPRGA